MTKETALKIIWDSCIHNEETKEAYEVLKNDTRPQGKWIEYDTASHHYKCNQCNADYNRFMVKPNFCPYCGADMR